MDQSIFSCVLNNQRFKFLAVGAINTVVGYLLFVGLYGLLFANIPFGYLASLAMSYAGAIVLAFFLYRRFVFPVAGHLLKDFVRFVGVYAVSIGINALALPGLVEILHVDPLLAQAIILIATTLVSYFGHRYFSFRRRVPDTLTEV
ncbi:GtrA family protein [Cryobacterium mannosilyticum]|uniref:GtrA family protein n=1 Tax=Cryobacterium mannosilyticum TaxID=1259190 RepID=A0A4R8W2I3_9MICO|nr:GtrA family protein [Cryobacterium mannosilyticum]TFC01220.1 GtrA family protein [Cryobacterium mannosilyticum]